MKLPVLQDAGDLRGKRVLVRVDFNLPFKDGAVRDDFRIESALPTIVYLKESGAKIILLSHHSLPGQSLEPIFAFFQKKFSDLPVRFVSDIYNTDSFSEHSDGDILFCENLRLWEGEQKNDPAFAQHLASLGDVYVNNAFGVAHREDASIVSLSRLLPAYAGKLFVREIEKLEQAFHPEHPALMILGGAKISSKLPLVEKLIDNFDFVFIGGALSNNFFKEAGHEIGDSVYDEADVDLAALRTNEKIIIPIDVVVKNKDGVFEKDPSEVVIGDKILDAGPKTVALLKEKIDQSEFVLMNGPIGDYEVEGFEKSTVEIIKQIGTRDIVSITGGGDSVALIFEAGLEKNFDFISTGGGAMLEFLLNRTLPGIEALQKE